MYLFSLNMSRFKRLKILIFVVVSKIERKY